MKKNPGIAKGGTPDDFVGTSLWRNGFYRGTATSDRKISGFFEQELLSLRRKVAHLVAEIPKDIPGLTVHDITHLDALWEIGSLAVGDRYALNPAEAYVLGCAIFLHDAGMCLASYPRRMDDVKTTDEWRDIVATRLRESGIAKPTETDLADPPTTLAKNVAALVLRALHAKHAEELPFIHWGGPDGSASEFLIDNADLRDFYGSLIGKVARSHHMAVADLPNYLGTAVGPFPRGVQDWAVDPVKIACILRVADAAHIDERRAPRFLYLLNKLEGQSAIHWSFQSKLGKPRVEGNSLVFSSGPDFGLMDADAWWLCYETAQSVDRELHAVDFLLDKHGETRFAARRVLGIESPVEFSGYVRTSGWVPIDAHLKVSDVPSIVKLLGGSHLYGDDPWVAIRELIQNASDAVRARRIMEGLSAADGRISIRLKSDGGEWWLEVEDNGVGMSESTLTGALLDFGKPFWSGEAAMREFPGLVAKGMSATGRFGIGFFSIFILGDLVRVTSRRFDASVESTRVLEFRSGLELRPVLRRPGKLELMSAAITRVSVRLKLSPFEKGGILAKQNWDNKIQKLDLKLVVGSLCPSVDVNVFVDTEGSGPVCVVGNDWQGVDAIQLFRRIAGTDLGQENTMKWENAYASNIRPLADENGKLYGRACIVGTIDHLIRVPGVCTVGGLKAAGLSYIGGVLCGHTENVRRDEATPTVPAAILLQWATEQASLISASKLPPRDKLRSAAVVLQCGGKIGALPIAVRGGEYLNFDEIKCILANEKEIVVFEQEDVEYDPDKDRCHPKDFNFEPDERLFFVWDDNDSILRVGNKRWPRDFIEPPDPASPLTFNGLFKKALAETWGPDYDHYDDECVVGFADRDEINRDVTVYRRAGNEG